MNKKIILIFISLLILLVLIFSLFLILSDKNIKIDDNKKNQNIEVSKKQEVVERKEIFVCKDLSCVENNFKKCEKSQYFENMKDVVNSRGIAIFGGTDSGCNVIISYDLRNSLKCILPNDLLNQDIFYKLWLSSLYKVDSSLEKYCKIDIVK